jgi:hypothetical protein
MKKIHYFLLLTLFVLAGGFSACENDEEDPDYDKRDDIAIKWKCAPYEQTDEGSTEAATFEVLITKSETVTTEVILNDFYWAGEKPIAILTGNILTFKNQQTIGDFKLTGDGTISDNLQSITWNYTLNDGFDTLVYTATFTPAAIAKKSGI